ncbi:TetR family transcriptional regulator [Actinotalea sp. M2MS4P-6]|uniref:TetR/AcrR family transcriptional regulator n=1 Tax=Actinotalea sp. M2MS4P-6 TaxID=2983762 RepID=UPI0021E38F2B|nr:TetR family transcriptional regulator [Actinotalea sp. M2MS4P-6]MCV2393238.1 TetR family transcriptional regulator [Actinotalea sp. M2MS4P-6]
MRSVESRDDATARSRIRDAALRRFAADGLGVGIRAIATDAGVSPALVLHHFGSKDGLRDACDDHAFAVIREVKRVALGPTGPDQLLVQLASVAEYAPVAGYLMRAMQSGGPRGREAFEHFVSDAEQYVAEGVAAGTLRPSRDEKARIRWLTLSGMGAMLLALALEDPPPDDLAAWLQRYTAEISLPALEAFTEGVLTDRRMLDAYLSYVSDPPARDETAAS